MTDALTLQRSISDVVAEYDHKRAALPAALSAFIKAGGTLKDAAAVGGGWVSLDVGNVHESELEQSLLKSAWRHIYEGLQIERIASASDKRRFQQALEKPPAFTIDNIRGTFGRFVLDPRGNILRGLAEVFCDLDPAYRSHNNVKIGTDRLPKRIIIRGVGGFGSWGKDRLENVLNALAVYQGKPLVTWREISALLDDEEALLRNAVLPKGAWSDPMPIVGRGIRLRRFNNGNGHLIFEMDTLRDINKALAEFYGAVLPDTPDERPAKPRPGTDVAKDLQYYPTPNEVISRVLGNLYVKKRERVLEPSCGDGRIMDALRRLGADVLGIEVHAGRAEIARRKGHDVLTANFLETVPTGDFDHVLMNPPFYGTHYAKHVNHAIGFLKPGGRLTAILPAAARYDHGLLDGRWDDLPVGSFSESGTNINTTVLTKWREE